MISRLRTSLSIALLLVWVPTCSSSVPRPRYVAQPASALVQVDFPAPPGRVEIVPEKPQSGAVWVRGEWQWQGRRWGWKAGVWVIPPDGASYAAWTQTRNAEGQLFYAPGTWRGANGAEIPSPKPLEQAKSRSGVVVNFEGDVEPTGQDVEPAGADSRTAPPESRDGASQRYRSTK
jgi:hypothetical protein